MGRSMTALLPSPLLVPSSHPHPLPSLLLPPTPVLLPPHHLLSLTHPVPPLPPPLSLLHPSHQCITHQSTSTPLRTHVRWPWGRGGAYWRVRVEPCLCSWMGEWCSLPVKKHNPFSTFFSLNLNLFSACLVFLLIYLFYRTLCHRCSFSLLCGPGEDCVSLVVLLGTLLE